MFRNHVRLLLTLFLLGICFPLAIQAGKTVYINPFDPDIYKTFYNPYLDPFSQKKEVLNPYCLFREGLERAGYTVKVTFSGDDMTDVAAVISWNQIHPYFLEKISHIPQKRCFLFNFEPHVMWPALYERDLTHYFGKIFVMFDDIVDNCHYFKFRFPQPKQQMLQRIPNFVEKKLCTLINTNKYSPVNHPSELFSKRLEVIHFFENLKEDVFDLYGMGWDGYRNWKGAFKWSWAWKWHVLKKYRFVFCYENMCNQNGYITEKIFDAFVGGCVPIYWGADNITDEVPKECFIDRRGFGSTEEVYDFIKNMDESTYQTYIQAIQDYLASPKASLYSVQAWLDLILKELEDLNCSNQ